MVSNYWRVISLINNVWYSRKKVLKNRLENTWYNSVHLCNKWKCKWHIVHRLVAEAFVINEMRKPYVNHIDWNKNNNNANNLEWCTAKENTCHAHAIWLITQTSFHTNNPSVKWVWHFLNKKVKQYTINGEIIAIFDSIQIAQNTLHIKWIWRVCSWHRFSAWWFRWSF